MYCAPIHPVGDYGLEFSVYVLLEKKITLVYRIGWRGKYKAITKNSFKKSSYPKSKEKLSIIISVASFI